MLPALDAQVKSLPDAMNEVRALDPLPPTIPVVTGSKLSVVEPSPS
jgi:hypothetical protein